MIPFRTTLVVRFGDVDSAGIVYYPRYPHYLHVGMERSVTVETHQDGKFVINLSSSLFSVTVNTNPNSLGDTLWTVTQQSTPPSHGESFALLDSAVARLFGMLITSRILHMISKERTTASQDNSNNFPKFILRDGTE